MESLPRLFQKQKRKKTYEEMSFRTQFKIEFLLPFTGCKKKLGKMPDNKGYHLFCWTDIYETSKIYTKKFKIYKKILDKIDFPKLFRWFIWKTHHY